MDQRKAEQRTKKKKTQITLVEDDDVGQAVLSPPTESASKQKK